MQSQSIMAQQKPKRANPGGRPKKDKSEKVAQGISVYFTQNELSEVEEFISKNNLKERKKSFLIKEIFLKKIRGGAVMFKKNTDPALLLQLNRIGNNLNQIAKKANSIDDLSQKDVDKLSETIEDISKFISQA